MVLSERSESKGFNLEECYYAGMYLVYIHRLQTAKRAIEDAAAMQYLDEQCTSRFISPNLSSRIPGGHERSSKRIPKFAS